MAPRSTRRPWTRAATVGVAAHLGYELAAGVAVPLASKLGVRSATALYALGAVLARRQAGRPPPSADGAFAALNGLFLSAVLAHYLTWPVTRRAGLPWLTQSEGLSGRLVPPYNAILYASALTAVGGLVENRRGVAWAAAAPVVAVPWLVAETPNEFRRLVAHAGQHPSWWNRRLHHDVARHGAQGCRGDSADGP